MLLNAKCTGSFLPELQNALKLLSTGGNPFNFIPHGGGTASVDHRCPGESITVELMRTAADFLLDRIPCDVPEENLETDFRRLPAMVRSCCVISNVRVL